MAKGLSKEKIIEEAKKLIEEKGLDHFSMHTIAARLQVKTASLYTHISNMDEVLMGASLDILEDYHQMQEKSINGLEKEDALMALARAERMYAKDHEAYYELIMNLQLSKHQELKDAAEIIVEPIGRVLNQYHLASSQKIHLQRLFRAIVFGFISQEKHGYFSHFDESTDDSFDFAIDLYAKEIEAIEDVD